VTARLRLDDESGFSLSEMLVVLAILGVVLGALTQLFLSGAQTTRDQSNRFRAQQEGRLALDGLRREIHCAENISGTIPGSSITITLGAYCPTNDTGADATVTWCALPASGTAPYSLWRTALNQPCTSSGSSCTSTGCVLKAEFLTVNQVFTGLVPAGAGLRAKLSVRLPVDASTTTAGGLYELQDDIVLRNTLR
jgi:prepilin-type N-terminal cleavage/methylation domain-containing protein